jgi:hypothetical protein
MRGCHRNSLSAVVSLALALIGPMVGGSVDAQGIRAPLQSEPGLSLARLAVAGTKTLAPEVYRDASAAAARGALPLEIALAIAGRFEGSVQHVIQVNEGSEAPSASRVTVLRDGLLDDSIRSERWEIALARTVAGTWRITEVKQAWRCRRGARPDRFDAVRCP